MTITTHARGDDALALQPHIPPSFQTSYKSLMRSRARLDFEKILPMKVSVRHDKHPTFVAEPQLLAKQLKRWYPTKAIDGE